MPVDELLQDAMLAHRAGRLAAAEVGYRRVLRTRPDEPRALHFLGLIHFHRGDRRAGLDHVAHALRVDAANPRRWNDYGGMLITAGRQSEATDAYRRATEVAPSLPEGWYNLGICQRDAGQFAYASDCLKQALRADPKYTRAYEALAMLLYQLGRMQEAAEVYGEWAAHDPANAIARHMAAAGSGANVPSRASDDYVRAHFDNAAATFDANLEQLAYQAPQLVARALSAARGADGVKLDMVLDAGCGTGLCGPLLRQQCVTLVGVDLSERMVERARARQCYVELGVAELEQVMRSSDGLFDAIVSADTLVYFGDLREPLNAAHRALTAGGLIAFTIEDWSGGQREDQLGDRPEDRLEDRLEGRAKDRLEGEREDRLEGEREDRLEGQREDRPEDRRGAGDYQLGLHGRYVHSEAHVRHALAGAGFEVVSFDRVTLRQERLHDVAGFCIVARKRAE